MASSDINNFSSSSPHRLPTLSASQALQDLASTPRKPIATGLKILDAALQGKDYDTSKQSDVIGGLSRGEVTEVYGAPGVGKTTFAIQASANVLQSGGSVVWVDASYRLVVSRLKAILVNSQHSQTRSPSPKQTSVSLDNFHHLTTPTLPHLLALVAHQSPSFPPSTTSLLVVDSMSTLIALAFPQSAEGVDRRQTPVKKSDAIQWASNRRWAVMGDLISKIGRFAATRNIAVLLTSQTTTRIRSETGAILHPAISGNAWDTGISNRIILYRDWLFQTTNASSSQGDYKSGARFAGVVKAKGVPYEGMIKISTFRIGTNGLQELDVDHTDFRSASPVLPATSVKRKREEIADSLSDDEEAASDREFG